MSATTSAIPDVWRVMTARMKSVGFSQVSDDPVAVWFGDPSQPQPDEDGNPPNATEAVVVAPIVATPDQEWGPIGNLAREEQWSFPIYVWTWLPGKTATEALDRLEELTAAIEADVRVIQASQRTNPQYIEEWFKYEMWAIAVEQVKPLIYIGEAGYEAKAEVLITCDFRVNKPERTA